MRTGNKAVEELTQQEYKYGFVTDIDTDLAPLGLNESTVRLISKKKNEPEWLLEWRLKAYRHWLTMKEPHWANIKYGPIDYQAIHYYAAPKPKGAGPKSLDEIDPEMRSMFEKLGISLAEQERLTGVAVDAVVDSVSVATTFKSKLAELGIVFSSFSDAVHSHPELIRQYLGMVVPYTVAKEAIEKELGTMEPFDLPTNGPAHTYKLAGALGSIGFISQISDDLCSRCNRLRLTADGQLRPCLMSDGEVDLRGPMRAGASHAELGAIFEHVVANKPERHYLAEGQKVTGRGMSQLGG